MKLFARKKHNECWVVSGERAREEGRVKIFNKNEKRRISDWSGAASVQPAQAAAGGQKMEIGLEGDSEEGG